MGGFYKICDGVKFLVSEKNGITVSINHNFGRIRSLNYHLAFNTELPLNEILKHHSAKLTVPHNKEITLRTEI